MANVTKKELGTRIRLLRKRRGMTQEQLAEASDLSNDSIRRLEAGRYTPNFDSLLKLSDGLNVPAPALISEKYDAPDDLAMMIRALPEPHLKLAHAMLGTLYVQAIVEKQDA